MTGSLQEKHGKYYVVVRIPDSLGKRKMKWINTGISSKGNNKRKAQTKMQEILYELETEKISYSPDISFLDWIEVWMEQKKNSIRLNSYEAYESYMKNHIKPFFEPLSISLKSVTPQHIQDFYNKKIKEGLSANSIHKYNSIINSALNDAVNKNMIAYNPATRATLPKKEKYIGKAYTAEQANNLLRIVKGTLIEPAVILGLYYGLRRSEVCGLRWKDIDFDRNIISIKNTVVRTTTLIEHEKTKSKASKRTMYIIPQTKDFLLKLRTSRIQSMEECGFVFSLDTHVCSWNDGHPYSPDYVTHKFNSILKSNNLPKIRFHELRHTAGSVLLEKGLTAKQIQEYLGHENVSTTLDIYGHLSLEGKKEAANVLDSLFIKEAK